MASEAIASIIERDMTCEASGCYVIENINISPEEVKDTPMIHVCFNLDYPLKGKPCVVN